MERNFLKATDLDALAMLDRPDELASFKQAVVRARVEPSIAAPHLLEEYLAARHVEAVEIGDSILAARRPLQQSGEIDDLFIVERETGYSEVGLPLCGLLFDADRASLGVEFDDATVFGIVFAVGENRRDALALRRTRTKRLKARAKEDIVAKDERNWPTGDELPADFEGLSQAFGPRSFDIFDLNREQRSVAQQLAVIGNIFRAGDNQHPSNAREDQCRQRVIDHRGLS